MSHQGHVSGFSIHTLPSVDYFLTLECFLETKILLHNFTSLATVASTGNTWLQLGWLHGDSGIRRQNAFLCALCSWTWNKFGVVISPEFHLGWKPRKPIFTQISEQMFREDRKCFLSSSSSWVSGCQFHGSSLRLAINSFGKAWVDSEGVLSLLLFVCLLLAAKLF